MHASASSSDTDLDAVLQRSIDLQVLAEVRRERVKQYCIEQGSRYRAATAPQEQWLLQTSLCQQLSLLSIRDKRKVHWADQLNDNTDLSDYVVTEADE
jgi:hypothetical protein